MGPNVSNLKLRHAGTRIVHADPSSLIVSIAHAQVSEKPPLSNTHAASVSNVDKPANKENTAGLPDPRPVRQGTQVIEISDNEEGGDGNGNHSSQAIQSQARQQVSCS
jgi:hypothetical protein